MKSASKIFYTLMLLLSAFTYGQENTVFITKSEPEDKPSPDYIFTQISISVPVRGNPYSNEIRAEYEAQGAEYKSTVLDYVIPNGLSLHGGMGVHLKSWVVVSANTGIDWIATEKLVSAPVYGSFMFIPQIWEEPNILLQAGYGRAFAIGRGNLSGEYRKFRFGLIFDNHVSIYADWSQNDFVLHELKSVTPISVGIAVYNF
jgi:hypothetical protein